MKRCLPTLFILLALLAGCRSDCALLCDRQAECLGGKGQGDLSIEKQSELCRTTCEAMSQDPDKQAALERTFPCADKPCGEFTRCVKAVTASQ